MERNSRREIKHEQEAGMEARWGRMSTGAVRNGTWILIYAQSIFESAGPISLRILLPLKSFKDGEKQWKGQMMWVV